MDTINPATQKYFELLKRNFICFFTLLFIGKLNYIFTTDFESLKIFDEKMLMRLPYNFFKNLRHATFLLSVPAQKQMAHDSLVLGVASFVERMKIAIFFRDTGFNKNASLV